LIHTEAIMSERIHIVLQSDEKERYRALAEREGSSLSAWIRTAVREKAAGYEAARRLGSREALADFFKSLDRDHDAERAGPEPDWEQHLSTIAASRTRGVMDP
jgi:hypothetical protein